MFLAQRRNGATKTLRNAVARCVVAPLREKSSSHKALFVQSFRVGQKATVFIERLNYLHHRTNFSGKK